MPKIFLTKITDNYDLPNTTEILSFLDDNLKASVIFEVTDEELKLLQQYYRNNNKYNEKYEIVVLAERPVFHKQLELAKAFAFEEEQRELKRLEAQKERLRKAEEKKKQKLLEEEKGLFEKLKKKFESEETCGKCDGTGDKFHSTKCINFYK